MAKIGLFGLPASGKGTVAQALLSEFGFEQLSTGDMIRRIKGEPGEVGDELRALPTGSFASDELMIKAVMGELGLEKYSRGVVFDGFPRTVAQLEAMDRAGVAFDASIYLDMSSKEDQEGLIDRAVNRRVHVASGRVYNLKSAPPKIEGFDDKTGEPLVWREDDHEVVIRRRFADYWAKTHPVVEELAKRSAAGGPTLIVVPGSQGRDAVWEQVRKSLPSPWDAARPKTPKA